MDLRPSSILALVAVSTFVACGDGDADTGATSATGTGGASGTAGGSSGTAGGSSGTAGQAGTGGGGSGAAGGAGGCMPKGVDAASDCDLKLQECGPCRACAATLPPGAKAAVLHCADDTGTQKTGEACDYDAAGVSNCAKGGMCARLDAPKGAQAARTCKAACVADSDCKSVSPDGWCANINLNPLDPAGPKQPLVCVNRCDLFGPNACAGGQACGLYPTADAKHDATCVTAGPGVEGATCQDFECQPGLGCVNVPADGKSSCFAWCDAAHPCKKGVCSPYGAKDSAPVGFCYIAPM